MDSLGNPIRFTVTPGQVHDCTQAAELIEDTPAKHLIADKGYDTNDLRTSLQEASIEAVIPAKCNRKEPIPYDKDLHKERNLMEIFFNKIKYFRRIATRYGKTARNYLAILYLVAAIIWLR